MFMATRAMVSWKVSIGLFLAILLGGCSGAQMDGAVRIDAPHPVGLQQLQTHGSQNEFADQWVTVFGSLERVEANFVLTGSNNDGSWQVVFRLNDERMRNCSEGLAGKPFVIVVGRFVGDGLLDDVEQVTDGTANCSILTYE